MWLMTYFNWELGKDLEFVKRFLLLIIIIPTGAQGSMQVFMPKTADKLDHVAGMLLTGIQRLKKFIPSPGFFSPAHFFKSLTLGTTFSFSAKT